jgi:hypothetical protein
MQTDWREELPGVGKEKNQTAIGRRLPKFSYTRSTLPFLLTPGDRTQVKKRRARLNWSGVECATHYQLQIRRENRKGETVVREKHLEGITYRTLKLEKDMTYVWRTRACNEAGCGKWAPWGEFFVKGKE